MYFATQLRVYYTVASLRVLRVLRRSFNITPNEKSDYEIDYLVGTNTTTEITNRSKLVSAALQLQKSVCQSINLALPVFIPLCT